MSSMPGDALEWLKRPIAHRGLHNARVDIVENSPSAIQAAIKKGYAVEVDVRAAACGTPVVFHDAALDRLTRSTGPVNEHTAKQLSALPYRRGSDTIMSLADLTELTAGRVPLIIEVKSDWSNTGGFEQRIATHLSAYQGHVAVMSFDPHSMRAFRKLAPWLPRGLISEGFFDRQYWADLSVFKRLWMRHLLTGLSVRPHFIAYDIKALPALAPLYFRYVLKRPLLTWTVRSAADRETAGRWTDAMIFEGFTP